METSALSVLSVDTGRTEWSTGAEGTHEWGGDSYTSGVCTHPTHRGLHVPPRARGGPLAAAAQARALRHARAHQAQDLLHLRLVHLRALLRAGEAVPHRAALGCGGRGGEGEEGGTQIVQAAE